MLMEKIESLDKELEEYLQMIQSIRLN
jgi:hypothetical protein